MRSLYYFLFIFLIFFVFLSVSIPFALLSCFFFFVSLALLFIFIISFWRVVHPRPVLRSEDDVVVVGFACLKCHALFKGKLSVVLFTNIVFLSFAYLVVAPPRPPGTTPLPCNFVVAQPKDKLALSLSLSRSRLDTVELGKANGPKRITPLVLERGEWIGA